MLTSPVLPATSSSGLLLSAPGGAAQVEVTVLTAGQAPAPGRTALSHVVPAGGTLLVSTTDLLAGRDGAVTVRSVAGSPPYVAGISVAGGRAGEPLLALSPLVARPSQVTVPGVTLDPWAGVRRDH
jgi:hypothetical protein